MTSVLDLAKTTGVSVHNLPIPTMSWSYGNMDSDEGREEYVKQTLHFAGLPRNNNTCVYMYKSYAKTNDKALCELECIEWNANKESQWREYLLKVLDSEYLLQKNLSKVHKDKAKNIARIREEVLHKYGVDFNP